MSHMSIRLRNKQSFKSIAKRAIGNGAFRLLVLLTLEKVLKPQLINVRLDLIDALPDEQVSLDLK